MVTSAVAAIQPMTSTHLARMTNAANAPDKPAALTSAGFCGVSSILVASQTMATDEQGGADVDEAMALIHLLASEVGPRRPTGPAERRAAELVADLLRSRGVAAALEPFRGYASFGYPFGLIIGAAIAPSLFGTKPKAPALGAGADGRRGARDGGVADQDAALAAPLAPSVAEPRRHDRATRRGRSDPLSDGSSRHLSQRNPVGPAVRRARQPMDHA